MGMKEFIIETWLAHLVKSQKRARWLAGHYLRRVTKLDKQIRDYYDKVNIRVYRR